MSSRKLQIGKIVGFRGLRGEVKVRCASEKPDWVDSLKHVELVLPGRVLQAEITSATGGETHMAILRFKGYPDRTSVEPLLNAELYAEEADLPAPAAGEYRTDDLLGLTVVDHETGRVWGTVKDLLSSSGSDFLELQLAGGKETTVVPFNDPFFPVVDLEKREIHVALLGDFLVDLLVNQPKPEEGKT